MDVTGNRDAEIRFEESRIDEVGLDSASEQSTILTVDPVAKYSSAGIIYEGESNHQLKYSDYEFREQREEKVSNTGIALSSSPMGASLEVVGPSFRTFYSPSNLEIELQDSHEVNNVMHRSCENYFPREWHSNFKPLAAVTKFDHLSALQMTYSAFLETIGETDGIPMSLLPELLDSSRFVGPGKNDALLEMLCKLDTRYQPGDPVRWDLLRQLAMLLDKKEISPPPFANPRASGSISPNSWKSLQRSPSRRLHPEYNYPALEPQVLEMMRGLDDYRKRCEREGNYLEARSAARRLQGLKLLEYNKRKGSLLQRHLKEKERAEKAYMTELEERHRVWKKRLADFHREVVDHATHSKRQHLIILENFRVKMASKAPSKPQWSGELLKQRKVQAFLGRQGKYLEAQELKRYADRLEHEELHATLQTYQAEVGLKEQTLRSKQQNELDVLLQRAAQGRDDLRRKRAKDYQRCHQRHRNIVRELKAMHAQELVSFEQLFGKRVKENRPQNRNSPSSSLSSGDGYSPLNLPDIGDSEVEEAISNVLGFGPTGTS